MSESTNLTAFRLATILVVALSLSIGWGIRGNFGHEYGAMIPGALAALAVCLLSGREDWRARAPYFAFFGALGWAFGGSMSYMQVVAYTHSGHLPTQVYGFLGLFALGFLWSSLGGGGTAFAAVADRARLAAVFRPLCWIFAFWVVYQKCFKLYLETLYPANFDTTWSRQAAHTYWFDADRMEVATAIIAILCFELWHHRAGHVTRLRPAILALIPLAGASLGALYALANVDSESVAGAASPWAVPVQALVGVVLFGLVVLLPRLVGAVVVGAVAGWALQAGIEAAGWSGWVASILIHHQVDPAFVARAAAERGLSEAEVLADQLINWPNVVLFYPQYIGALVGALVGLGGYFCKFGRFASGASLFLYMALGWFGCFILFPVLLGHPVDCGPMLFRMTPPRGDNWAGVLGATLGAWLWMLRKGYVPVAQAMLLTGMLGGVAFATGTFIKLMLVRPGNVQVESDPAVIEAWAHWQQANWHSVMEQTHGFLFGIALAVAMAYLARRSGRNDGPPSTRDWSWVFACGFVLFGVVYLNMHKNVVEWVNRDLMPEVMKMPLFGRIEFSAWTWFNLVFAVAALTGIGLMVRHKRHPIALVPATAAGRGQMLFVALVAAVTTMNFDRAIAGFTDQRLITEAVIFLNGTLVIALLLSLTGPGVTVPAVGRIHYGRDLRRIFLRGVASAVLLAFALTGMVRWVYDGQFAGHAGKHMRFGVDAEWRVKPTEKSKSHS